MIISTFPRVVGQSTTNPASNIFDRCWHTKSRFRQFLWILLPMLLYCPSTVIAANSKIPDNTESHMKPPPESPAKYSSVLYRSGNRRDPFINPLLVNKKDKQPRDEEISRGVPPPGIAGTYISQATLQGIAVRDNGKVAVFRGADSRAYFLRKGDKLFDGFLRDIQDDSVILVRETRLRSGKTLTQDVIKRLRKP